MKYFYKEEIFYFYDKKLKKTPATLNIRMHCGLFCPVQCGTSWIISATKNKYLGNCTRSYFKEI